MRCRFPLTRFSAFLFFAHSIPDRENKKFPKKKVDGTNKNNALIAFLQRLRTFFPPTFIKYEPGKLPPRGERQSLDRVVYSPSLARFLIY
jgi:hypothetical protein